MKKIKKEKNLLSLKELKEEKAVLEGAMGEISLDLRYLPKKLNVGDRFLFNVLPENEEIAEKQKSAKEILNEILDI